MSSTWDEIIEEIRHANDIVEVISERVALKKTGKYFVGLCPFHVEKTPSFTVSEDRQFYHCFGCGAGGDVFSFLMNVDRISFREAVYALAKRAGIEITPRRSSASNETLDKKRRALEALSVAVDYYQQNLHSEAGVQALNYLKQRGIVEDSAREFKLGFALDSWDGLITASKTRGIRTDALIDAGLVQRRSSGDGLYDRFRNRIVFPILDVSGNIIGFGGRSLDGSHPKYLNSPESPVFSKGKNLYGFYHGKEAIRRSGQVVVVEGYMDALTAQQNGLPNVVATLGTALTQDQVRMLASFASEVVIAYDADTAGLKATLRGVELFKGTGCSVRVGVIPNGHDPDDYIRQHGSESFKKIIDDAMPVLQYKLHLTYQGKDLNTAKGRAAAASAAVSILASEENEVEVSVYAKEVAKRLRIPVETLEKEILKARSRASKLLRHKVAVNSNNNSQKVEKLAANGFEVGSRKAEETLVGLMLLRPATVAKIREVLSDLKFFDANMESLKRAIFELDSRGKYGGIETLLHDLEFYRLGGEDMVAAASSVAMKCNIPDQPELEDKVIADCIQTLKKRRAALLRKQIASFVGDHASPEQVKRLAEYQGLLKETKG